MLDGQPNGEAISHGGLPADMATRWLQPVEQLHLVIGIHRVKARDLPSRNLLGDLAERALSNLHFVVKESLWVRQGRNTKRLGTPNK